MNGSEAAKVVGTELGAEVATHVVADPSRAAKLVVLLYFMVHSLLMAWGVVAFVQLDKRISNIEVILKLRLDRIEQDIDDLKKH